MDRFKYERELLARGPASAATRFVLIVISTHCRRRGSCETWVSLTALEAETGLARHTIIGAINVAVSAGWLGKRYDQLGGMKRRGNVYSLTVPTSAPTAPVSRSRSSRSNPQTSAPAAPVEPRRPVQPRAETSAIGSGDQCDRPISTGAAGAPLVIGASCEIRRRREVEVQEERKAFEVGPLKGISYLLGKIEAKTDSATSNTSPHDGSKGALQQKGHNLDTWAEAHGITRSGRETEDAYRRRCVDAWAKSKTARTEIGLRIKLNYSAALTSARLELARRRSI